jgi:tellurite resistance protein
MNVDFIDTDSADFNAKTYLQILIAIAKADRDNSTPEYQFVRRQATRLGLDYETYLKTTDKSFSFGIQKTSRLTALVVLRDAILLASMDGNFSLPERERIYGYAEKLDIARNDVNALEDLIEDYMQLDQRWQHLVKSS